MNIHAAKLLGFTDSVHNLDNKRNRISIFDSQSVEGSVIHTEVETAIWLLNE